MANKRIHPCLFTLIVIFLVFVCAFIPGCQRYREYVQLKGDVHFSFEYPAYYENTSNDVFSGYTNIGFTHPKEEGFWDGFSFHICARKIGWNNRYTAIEYLEYYVDNISDYLKDFQLLERSEITILDNDGELILTSLILVPSTMDYNLGVQKDTPVFSKDIFFDCDGYMWEISFLSPVNQAEENFKVFEHILESFKILD